MRPLFAQPAPRLELTDSSLPAIRVSRDVHASSLSGSLTMAYEPRGDRGDRGGGDGQDGAYVKMRGRRK